jgi:DNA-binding PadR family transcriptional regulator
MARVRQTDLAVLGALSVGPMSGYAVREAITDVLGQFWSESFGQIYPALARLEADGHVERVAGGRPGSSEFALTAAGRHRLAELLRTPAVPAPPRNGTLLRLFFGHVLGPAECAALVREHRDRAVAGLDRLAEQRAQVEAEPDDPHRPYALLTLAAGEHSARAAIAWADEALDVLGDLGARD